MDKCKMWMFARFWLQILLDFDLSTLLKCVRTQLLVLIESYSIQQKKIESYSALNRKKKKIWSQYDKQLFKKSTKHGIPTGD